MGFLVGVVGSAERWLEATRDETDAADAVEGEFADWRFGDDRRLRTVGADGRGLDRAVDSAELARVFRARHVDGGVLEEKADVVELGLAFEDWRFDRGVLGDDFVIACSGGDSPLSKNFRRVSSKLAFETHFSIRH